MPRIVIATIGSLGDLHPALALALGLRARNHEVTIATCEAYRTRIESLGLRFATLRPDPSPEDDALVRRIMDGSSGSEYLMRELVFPAVREMYADLSPLAARADLLLSSELLCAMPIIGELTGKPWAFFSLSPISFFPRHDPPLLPGPPGTHLLQSLGPAASRLLFRMAKLVSHSWWRPVRQLRRELGLPPGRSPMFEGKFSPYLNLALFSSMMQAPQPDWPRGTVQSGFLFHDEEKTSPELPPPVERFLQTGPPPLVFTLGSAAVTLARDFYNVSAQAARSLGQRALLLLGKNPAPPDLPPTMLAWNYLPYAQVFPRAAAIVHQGGIGTTAQALRAGRPMLVVPFAHDQFDNAARVTRLGVARTLARRNYRPAMVARSLGTLLESNSLASKAQNVGTTVRGERGLALTCEAIERLLSSENLHARAT